MAYVTFADVVLRYPLLKTSYQFTADVSSDVIYYAEKQLEGMLASHFTVPFAAAHPTVKDLAIDMSYYKAISLVDPDKAEKIWTTIGRRIDALKAGKESMITGSGTLDPAATSRGAVWSNVSDYHPVHSMLDADDGYTMISSERLIDEIDARG